MTTSFCAKTVLVLIVVFIHHSLWAQEGWKEMEWKSYAIDFKVPKDFEIKESMGKIFTASGDGFTLSIQPWQDSSLTAEQVAAKAQEDLDATDVTVTSREKVDLKGFEGYEIVGAGKQDGKAMLFAVLGFIDPHGDTNFSAYILFWDDPNENEKNIKIAEEIIEGISKQE
jgi:hypothetical protein